MNEEPTYIIDTQKTPNVVANEPFVLEDKEGNKLLAPYKPNKKCKKCFGRGWLGKDVINGGLIVCYKCYPKHR